MIDLQIFEVAARKQQTSRDNLLREYCQHLFLSSFYRQKGSERVLFKGGTSLRIIWNSPRFSEDLDFSGFHLNQQSIEDMLQETLIDIGRENIDIRINEAKKTSGGFLAQLQFKWLEVSVPIKLEISGRKKEQPQWEQALISNEWFPAYTLLHLPQVDIITEKLEALTSRAKPRDYFDLYFILRNRMAFQEAVKKKRELKKIILTQLHARDVGFSKELKRFLPVSHHALLKDFPKLLEQELERAFP